MAHSETLCIHPHTLPANHHYTMSHLVEHDLDPEELEQEEDAYQTQDGSQWGELAGALSRTGAR